MPRGHHTGASLLQIFANKKQVYFFIWHKVQKNVLVDEKVLFSPRQARTIVTLAVARAVKHSSLSRCKKCNLTLARGTYHTTLSSINQSGCAIDQKAQSVWLTLFRGGGK